TSTLLLHAIHQTKRPSIRRRVRSSGHCLGRFWNASPFRLQNRLSFLIDAVRNSAGTEPSPVADLSRNSRMGNQSNRPSAGTVPRDSIELMLLARSAARRSTNSSLTMPGAFLYTRTCQADRGEPKRKEVAESRRRVKRQHVCSSRNRSGT